jgi:diguanylate cyclase (GGDEF)-like protein
LRAETDQLTELWNHGSLIEQTDEMVDQGTRFAMLMVDLDFFKRFNDQHGHQQGNVLLREVASALRSSCREADRVFRFGGDEFALVLPETGLAGARTVAEKVQAAVEALTRSKDVAPVTCSVGIAVFPTDGPDGASVILAADRACYAAKRKGRNQIATAIEGLALAAEFEPTLPTPAEALEPSYSVA